VAVFLCLVLWEIRNVRDTKGRVSIYKNVRIILFMFWFLYVFTFVFAYRFYFTSNETSFTNAFTKYATCALTATTCKNANPPDVNLYYLFCFTISVQAIGVAFLFGSTKEMLTFWSDRFKNLHDGRSFFSGVELTVTSASKKSTSGGGDN